jgi:chaperonin cofactor prefoldin
MKKIMPILGIVLIAVLGISLYEMITYRKLYRDLKDDYEGLEKTYTDLAQSHEDLQKTYDDLSDQIASLQEKFDTLQDDHTSLSDEYAALRERYTTLEDQYTALQSSYTEKEGEYEDLEKAYSMLQEEYQQLKEAYDNVEEKYTFSHGIHPLMVSNYVEMVSRYNEEVQTLANELGEGKGFLGKIIFIYTYVSQQIPYEPDPPNREVIQSPIRTYQIKKGDCEDQAIFLACLLMIEGYEVQLNFVDRDHAFDDLKEEELSPNHVTASVYIPDEYLDDLTEYTSGKKYYISENWLWLEPTSTAYIGYTDEIYPFISFEV